MTDATDSWPNTETDPQRTAILTAADRLLAGTPRHSSGNLSVIQLAVEAQVKYWVVAQKHTDLRNHFRALAEAARLARETPEAGSRTSQEHDYRREERDRLREHCHRLERLLETYATVINELAIENQVLRDQHKTLSAVVAPFARS